MKDGISKERLREGASLRCPACGADTVVKRRTRMDGWTCVGEELYCPLCSASLGEPSTARRSSGALPAADAEKLSSLEALLGERAERKKRLESEEGFFCRDCRHFLRHPFVSRCLLHDRPTEPMQDCEDFERAAGADEQAEAQEEEEE